MDRRLGTLSLAALDDVRLQLYAMNRGVSSMTWGMEFSYLGKILRIARTAWKLPVQGDLVKTARAALEMLDHVTPPNERDRRPTAEELDRLCRHFDAKRRQRVPMGDIIRFSVVTAMRVSEIMSLRWNELKARS